MSATIMLFKSKERKMRGEHPVERVARLADERKMHNGMLVDRIKGVAAQPGTPETDADPLNPNVQS